MMRVISSPSSSTTGLATLILGMERGFRWRETRDMRARRPYSIGALMGKAVSGAGLTRITLTALALLMSGRGACERQRARDPLRDRGILRQGRGAAGRLLHQAHLAGKLVPAECGEPRRRARGGAVHAGDRERARAHRSVRSGVGDPGLRAALERAQA